jgi:hypothetical protein
MGRVNSNVRRLLKLESGSVTTRSAAMAALISVVCLLAVTSFAPNASGALLRDTSMSAPDVGLK